MSGARLRLSDLAGGGTGGGSAAGGSVAGGSAGGSAGGDELRHSGGAWLRAAGGAEGMGAHLGPVRVELTTAHEGLTAGTAGLSALVELGVVQESWVRRFESARHECGALAGSLRAVARAQSETNESVRSSFSPVARRTHGVER
ncbi:MULTISPECIES: hypothetical protein [unclassified Streptomyces]|uniref:hypothetical protein n=1 Tax=unclassified Streptomyces TaxID=2593676 RepID=UPI002ED2E9CE|nr:hypothetical protein OH827_17990 [Streptomyces sp. NBC_00891]WSY06775.1 hypothetical protein OG464_17990 [Streptomyces sp. NBC_00890]WSZ08400.1 hypothetical protein OG704_17990 [Streptomyces sp. NBC_00869]WSZ24102.1 hypothetical protein OG498_15575 [Streptomyces sp. NBC_00870]